MTHEEIPRPEGLIGAHQIPEIIDHLDADSSIRQRMLQELFPPSQPDTWLQAVDDNLEQLLGLKEGWNGPRSRPVDRVALASLIAIIAALEPPPIAVHLVPQSSGGVQAEWHAPTRVVELVVDVDRRCALQSGLSGAADEVHFDVADVQRIETGALRLARSCLAQLTGQQSQETSRG